MPEASEYLDALRQELANVCEFLPELRESVAQEVPREYAQYIHHCTIMPELGFIIAVRLDPETGEGYYHGQHHPEGGWTMCFTTEDIVYYKNQTMLDLDSQYGDLLSRIAGKSDGARGQQS